MDKALRDIIAAWDHLPEGNYSSYIVQRWLKDQMAPAIQAGRVALAEEAKQ